jgi:hypothetical protein
VIRSGAGRARLCNRVFGSDICPKLLLDQEKRREMRSKGANPCVCVAPLNANHAN